MRKSKLIVLPLAFALLLSGCSVGNNTESKRKQIEEYNTLIESTISSFADSKAYAELHQRDVLGYLQNNNDWGNLESKEEYSENVSPEVLKHFANSSVLYNDFFTSVGASSVRQVLVLMGDGFVMYATIVWSKDGVVSLTRQVSSL